MDKAFEFQTIDTDGIGFLAKLEESDLYYGLSVPCGDLYEAEELFVDGGKFDSNRLVFVCFEENRVYEPLKAEKGSYFERPVCIEEVIVRDLTDGKILERHDGFIYRINGKEYIVR